MKNISCLRFIHTTWILIFLGLHITGAWTKTLHVPLKQTKYELELLALAGIMAALHKSMNPQQFAKSYVRFAHPGTVFHRFTQRNKSTTYGNAFA